MVKPHWDGGIDRVSGSVWVEMYVGSRSVLTENLTCKPAKALLRVVSFPSVWWAEFAKELRWAQDSELVFCLEPLAKSQ